MGVFVSQFGQFLHQDLFDYELIPDISISSLASNPPVTQSNLAAFTANPPQSASLILVLSDDDQEDGKTSLLDELADENIILQMLETE